MKSKYMNYLWYLLVLVVVLLPLVTFQMPACGETNTWLMGPKAISRIAGAGTMVTKVFLALIQLGTLLTSGMLFRKVFESKEGAFFATLFYMTLPYRHYLLYDAGMWARAMALMLLPLFVRLLISVYTVEKRQIWKWTLAAGAVFAAVAYSDWVIGVLLADVVLVSALWYRKARGLAPLVPGLVLYLPDARKLLQYFFVGGLEEYQLPLGSIMGNGYRFGRFLTSFMYREGLPGIGLGLLGALVLLVGLAFVGENFHWEKKCTFPAVVAGVMMILSLAVFPWDLVQRLGMPFVRMVGLVVSPAVFFGFAGLPLSMLGGAGVEAFGKAETDKVKFVQILLILASLGASIYMAVA